MAFIDPEFYQGSRLQEETEARAARAAVEEIDGGSPRLPIAVSYTHLRAHET